MVSISTDKRKKYRKIRVSFFDFTAGKWRNKYFLSKRQGAEFARLQQELEDAVRGNLKIPIKEIKLQDYMPIFWDRFRINPSYKSAKSRYKYISHLGFLTISRIKQSDIIRVRDQAQSRNLSSQSVNHILNLVSSIFREAILDGYATTNPVKGIDRPKIIRRHTPRVLTDHEINLLIRFADERIFAGLLLGLNCGLRKSEIIHARFEDVNFSNQILTVDNRPETGERTKSGRVRYVPFSTALMDFLKSQGKYKEVKL